MRRLTFHPFDITALASVFALRSPMLAMDMRDCLPSVAQRTISKDTAAASDATIMGHPQQAASLGSPQERGGCAPRTCSQRVRR